MRYGSRISFVRVCITPWQLLITCLLSTTQSSASPIAEIGTNWHSLVRADLLKASLHLMMKQYLTSRIQKIKTWQSDSYATDRNVSTPSFKTRGMTAFVFLRTDLKSKAKIRLFHKWCWILTLSNWKWRKLTASSTHRSKILTTVVACFQKFCLWKQICWP